VFGPMHHCLKGAADQRRKRRKQSSSDRSTKVREYSETSHYRRSRRGGGASIGHGRGSAEAEEKVGGRGGRGEACLDSKIGSLKSVEAEAKARQRRGKAKRKREDAEEAD
jgi:hypothetical protein